MLGWWITIYAYEKSPEDCRFMDVDDRAFILARWEAGVDGLGWLVRLVHTGKARPLLEDGYPNLYTAKAADVLPLLAGDGIKPRKGGPWVFDLDEDEEDARSPGWMGEVETFPDRIAACTAGQMLSIEAWDQS